MPAGLGEALLQEPSRSLDCGPQDALRACLSGLRFVACRDMGAGQSQVLPEPCA